MSSHEWSEHSDYHHIVRLRSVFTLPNVITMIRIAMLPFFVLLMGDERVVAGSWFFGLLAFTDWIDGFVARRFNQVSEFGKVLDPVADRLIFFVGIGTVMYYDFFPVWLGIVILVREVAIAVLMVGEAGGVWSDVCCSMDHDWDSWRLVGSVYLHWLGSGRSWGDLLICVFCSVFTGREGQHVLGT